MKQIILFISVLFGTLYHNNIYCQTKEYEFSIGTGSFHYNYVPSAENIAYSFVYYGIFRTIVRDPVVYPDNPWGNKPGFSWHLWAGSKKINKRGFIFDWQIYYENRQTQKNVTTIVTADSVTGVLHFLPATGEIKLTNYMIGINAAFGKRWLLNSKTHIDALLGIDYLLTLSDKAHLVLDAYTSPVYWPPNGLSLHKNVTNNDIGVDGADQRINGKLEIGHKNWGVNIGYAIGFDNAPYSSSRPFIRFDFKNSSTGRYLYTGLVYRIKRLPKQQHRRNN